MIGIHKAGGAAFIEIVPWGGEIKWDVESWGQWRLAGQSPKYVCWWRPAVGRWTAPSSREKALNMGLDD